MLGLPKSTELNKQLPKKAIYAKFNMNNASKERFDANISRISIVNEVSPNTITAISASELTPSFYVLLVQLKTKNIDKKVIEQITKLINQKMILILEYEDECKLALLQTRLLESDWRATKDCHIKLQGLDMDSIWRNVVTQVGDFEVSDGLTLDEQIILDEKNTKIQLEIEKLEKMARKETQPKKKYDLVERIHNLERLRGER